MLHRRKPLSAKQRREQLMLKRAVKRGDVPPPPPSKPDRRVRKPRKAQNSQPANPAAASSRRLESSFTKLPKAFLKKTEILASRLPLTRPLPPDVAIFHDVGQGASQADRSGSPNLTCPRRPKWRYDMSKKEVEANEEGLFRKWLAETDAAVNAWCNVEETPESDVRAQPQRQAEPQEPQNAEEPEDMPHAPTSFERNLEVWRQVWRVTESSQILLILLDSRCPTLHFPPALSSYLSSVSNADRIRPILVLTKVDISGPARAAAWTRYLRTLYPALRVVEVESYVEKPHPNASGSRKRTYEPHLPTPFRKALVDALRETHAELLEPPESVKGDPARAARWRPRVKSQVDWDAVLRAQGEKVGKAVGGAHARKPSETASEEHAGAEGLRNEGERSDEESEPEFLTIGLIGQPNVGKSSLLNALFGTHKVKASRTPGKTKHFQTLFWTSEVRLVDCPGLVFPNYVPMETQVLGAILPISRVSAIPLCVHHAAQLLPLEQILGLEHPSLAEPLTEDKRTWREGMRPRGTTGGQDRHKEPVWTTMDILTAYALKKGWITAKVGRPDVKRAGNAILRALAEGRIRWAFWPPGTDPETIRAHQPVEGAGIWIGQNPNGGTHDPYDLDVDEEEEAARTASGSEDGGSDASSEGEEDSDGEEPENEDEAEDVDEGEDEDVGEDEHEGDVVEKPGGRRPPALGGTTGRFGALSLDDQDGEQDEDDENEE